MDKKMLKAILETALANGGDFAEIYFERRESTAITCEGGSVERINTGIDSGVGIRVITGDNTAYAYTNDLGLDNVRKIATTAAQASQSDCRNPVLDFTKPAEAVQQPALERPEVIDLDVKVQQLKIADEAARALNEAIAQVSVSYSDVCQQVTIANSLGTCVSDERIRTRMACNAIARGPEGLVQTGFASAGGAQGFELLRQRDPQSLGQEAAQRAVLLLGAQACPSGKMPVVMSSAAGGTMVHEACGHGLEGDLVEKGMSVYAGKLGEQVASPLITVVDDATLPGCYGAYAYDDEGEPGRKNVLIEDGFLQAYMYDGHSARKVGAASTGNGRRESYRSKPITRMSNTYIASGDDKAEDIIASTKKGLLVTKMGGGQVNSLNGDYVFDVAEGYMIIDGEVAYPVRGATLAGNGPKSLRQVEMVADDLGYAIGTCGKSGQSAPVADAQPTMKIGGLVVGGVGGGEQQIARDFNIQRR